MGYCLLLPSHSFSFLLLTSPYFSFLLLLSPLDSYEHSSHTNEFNRAVWRNYLVYFTPNSFRTRGLVTTFSCCSLAVDVYGPVTSVAVLVEEEPGSAGVVVPVEGNVTVVVGGAVLWVRVDSWARTHSSGGCSRPWKEIWLQIQLSSKLNLTTKTLSIFYEIVLKIKVLLQQFSKPLDFAYTYTLRGSPLSLRREPIIRKIGYIFTP